MILIAAVPYAANGASTGSSAGVENVAALPRLLVFEFSATLGIDPDLARLLGEMTVARLQAIGRHEVMSSADVATLLDAERQKQLVGCSDESCLAEIGGALGAELLVVGNVSRLGGRAVLTLKLIDTRETKLVKQLADELPADESEFSERIRVASFTLLDITVPPRPEEPVPWFRNPWLWGAVGAVVVGGTVGGYFLLRPPSAPGAGLGKVVIDAP